MGLICITHCNPHAKFYSACEVHRPGQPTSHHLLNQVTTGLSSVAGLNFALTALSVRAVALGRGCVETGRYGRLPQVRRRREWRGSSRALIAASRCFPGSAG